MNTLDYEYFPSTEDLWLTCDKDRSRESGQIRWAAVWTVHEGGNGAGAIVYDMLPQATSKSLPSTDKKHDFLVLRIIGNPYWLGNTSDGKGMGLGWKVADRRQDDIGVLAWTPAEAAPEGKSDSVC